METTIPKTARPTPEMPSSTRVEARKPANLGFEDTSWPQVIPVTACIGVCAPEAHARHTSCRLGRKSRADRTRWRAQKTKRMAHPYFPYPLTDVTAVMQIFVKAPTLKPLRRSA